MPAAVHLGGKLGGPGRLNAVAPGQLVHVMCQLSRRRFLLVTGAAYSVLPHHSSAVATSPRITGPSGSVIPCWGELSLNVMFFGRKYSWTFLLAAVSFPIIGIDFLKHFNLLVDPAAGSLIHADGPTPAVLCAVQDPHSLVATIEAAEQGTRRLIVEFQDVANPSKRLPDVRHAVTHHLKTTGPPVSSRFRRLDGPKLAAAKAEFLQLEREGIVRRSSSPWASPLHMVLKSDGTWRPCGDYRRLNLVTEVDRYPLPNLLDFVSRLSGSTVFSKLDLRKGYYQIPMNEDDIHKTAVTTPFGLWEFTRMPFGLKNAGMSFQRLIDRAVAGLDNVFGYLDDLLVFSPNQAAHAVHLRQVLDRLRQFGLVLHLEKCAFDQRSVEYLGHSVSAAGVVPLPSNVAAVANHPPPNTIKELQGFLGMVNFYRRFIPSAAAVLLPLTDCLKGGKKGPEKVQWSPALELAFIAAKEALARAACLAHPAATAELELAVDASATHVGAALQQRSSPSTPWQPLGFYSSKLSPAAQKYSAFDRELLACYQAVRHYRHLLEGRSFHILTDHKPLTFALSRVTDPWTPRQCRQLAYIAEYTSDVRHIAGTDNVVADTLSRPPTSDHRPPVGHLPSSPVSTTSDRVKVPSGSPVALQGESELAVPVSSSPADWITAVAAASTSPTVDFAAVAAHQLTCPSVAAARDNPSFQVQLVLMEGVRLWCDTSGGRIRPVLPEQDRRNVFTAIHTLSHTGVRATTRLVSSRFVWCKMATDIKEWCRDCTSCGIAKVTTQPTAAVTPIPVPAQRFSHIHVDLVGPLPVSALGHTHLLTIVDRSTRWLEAIPLSDISASSIADNLVASWIARFGVPAAITSDRGPQFTSAVWAVLCDTLGIRHRQTTAYHPQANGMVERVHRRLKEALKARSAAGKWLDHLPWVLFGLRTAPRDDNGISAAEMVYGSALTLPAQPRAPTPPGPPIPTPPVHLPPPTSRTWSEVASAPPLPLQNATYVYVRRGSPAGPLDPPYAGPFEVIRRGPKSFDVAMGHRTETVSVDRLKPHCGSAPVRPALPPRRGRPRTAPAGSSSVPDGPS